MNYHVYFKRIRDVNNKSVADIVGHQIITSDDAFIESVTKGVVEQKLDFSMFGKNYIKYTIVDNRTGETIAKVDNRYNVFSLEDLYLGTIVNHIVRTFCVFGIIFLALVSLILSMLFIKSTIKMKVDSVLIVKEANGEVVTTEWNVFGELKSEKVLYPGKSGHYYFTIINENDVDLNIVGEFTDDNPYLVPMKYRLECTDGTVISDEWVTLEELFLTISCLPAHSEQTYHLEWVWLTESDELDTIIGSTEGAKYTIKIELTSTIINN
jgi:hypothetical protein